MARDYQKLLRGERVLVPRWVVIGVVAAGLLWVGLKIMVPPRWTVQRLDSPNGERAASAACTAGSGLCVSHCNSSGGVPGFAAIAGWRSERDPTIQTNSAKEVWGFQAATRSGSTPVV